jgi:hypothetical protein
MSICRGSDDHPRRVFGRSPPSHLSTAYSTAGGSRFTRLSSWIISADAVSAASSAFFPRAWHPETLIGPSAAGFAFDINDSYTLPILATVGANIIAAGIIAVMSIPLAKWHIPFRQTGSHTWTSGSAS